MLNVEHHWSNQHRHPCQYWLIWDVHVQEKAGIPDDHLMFKPVKKWLYSIDLMEVKENEHKMASGRFHAYDRAAVGQTVVTRHPSATAVTAQRIEWIAENATGRWNLELEPQHVGASFHYWTFTSLRDAALFKMTFCFSSQDGVRE